MSNVLTRAARLIRLPPIEKAVLMALADMARHPDDAEAPCQAWPPMHGKDGAVGLCEWTCLSERTVQRAVKALVAAGLIERRQLSHGARYTITLPASPVTQSGDTQSGDCQSGDTQTPSPVRVTPKALGSATERKKASPSPSKRRAASALDLPPLPDGLTETAWAEYVEMRVAMSRGAKGRPWTPGAARQAIAKLTALAAAGHDPAAALAESVLNGWQGIFEPKEKHDGRTGNGGTRPDALRGARPDPAVDMYRAALARPEDGSSIDPQGGRRDRASLPAILQRRP